MELADELAHPGLVDRWELHGADAGQELTFDVVIVLDARRAGVGIVVEHASRLVAVIDPTLAPPRSSGLELRGPGLWLDLSVGEPRTQVTVSVEAFGVILDTREGAGPDTRGVVIPLGMDLDWVVSATSDEPEVWTGDGVHIDCDVVGSVTVGDRRLDVRGTGWRTHRWGDGSEGAELWSL